MNKADLIEALADIEHERWRKHQRRIHDTSFEIEEPIILPGDYRQTEPGALVIEAPRAKYWQVMAETPYAGLAEPYKQEIRDHIGESWPLIVDFFAEWIEGYWGIEAPETAAMVACLREDMA